MSPILQPWHILLACLCGLVNQRQQQIIEFQNAQIEALLNQLGRKRLLLDDDQRRLLAVKAYGIEPEPDRQRTPAWSTILKAHGNSIFATDFTTVEVGTRSGLVTFYILAVMHVQTRRVHIAGITPSPNCTWIRQVCRNLTDCEDGILRNASHLIVDRESSFIPLRGFVEQNT